MASCAQPRRKLKLPACGGEAIARAFGEAGASVVVNYRSQPEEAQFLCAQEAVRRFRTQGLDEKRSRALGKIVFISSVHQRIPWAGHANYAAAKGGVKLLMQSMAQELSAEKIRVNAIAPGAIRTPINRSEWDTGQAERSLLKLIPYGRIGEPQDVARAATWLACDLSDYVVGTTLFVDGGMALYPAFRQGG